MFTRIPVNWSLSCVCLSHINLMRFPTVFHQPLKKTWHMRSSRDFRSRVPPSCARDVVSPPSRSSDTIKRDMIWHDMVSQHMVHVVRMIYHIAACHVMACHVIQHCVLLCMWLHEMSCVGIVCKLLMSMLWGEIMLRLYASCMLWYVAVFLSLSLLHVCVDGAASSSLVLVPSFWSWAP